MSRRAIERQRQLEFVRNNSELGYGSTAELALSPEDLLRTDSNSPWTVGYLSAGLTNHIYKIEDCGRFYALKLRRNPILVNNVDGQVSFINEIERRIEIETLRQHAPADWMFAVETVYADHGSGIILSPWVDGRPLEFNATELGDLFDALVEFAANGFFEWDLCRGNYLWTNSGIRLFDYGYTYRFDPLSELNSNGGAPTVFNIIERFESRCFFGHLLHLLEHSGLEAVLAVYFLEKGLAMRAFEQLRSRLAARGATHGVLSYYNEIIRRTRSALKDPNDLRTLFRLEAFRSWRLDVEDDLSGKICNAATLSKARILARIAAEDYRFLNDHDGLFFGEELMSEHDLVAKYDERLRNVQALLEASTLPRPGAKVGRHEP